MIVPTFEKVPAIQLEGDSTGFYTDVWHNLLLQLLQEMQRTVSNEGFVMPPLDANDREVVQASFNNDGGVETGTIIFAPDLINGGTTDKPNGQLMVLLGDGTFHAITNS